MIEKWQETDKLNKAGLHKCSVCNETKPLSDFYKDKKSRSGVRSECKKCKLSRERTPEELERKKLYNRERCKSDPRISMLSSAKSRAKKYGIPFDLVLDDIYIPKSCPVFGVPFESGFGKGKPNPNSPSLDRMVPEKGYVPGNIMVICDRANRIKRDGTPEEFHRLAQFLRAFERMKNLGQQTIVNLNVVMAKSPEDIKPFIKTGKEEDLQKDN